MKCKVRISAVSLGAYVCDKEKEMVLYNASYLNARDKICLVRPYENVVMFSELALSRVGLRTLRCIVEEKVSKYNAMKYLVVPMKYMVMCKNLAFVPI